MKRDPVCSAVLLTVLLHVTSCRNDRPAAIAGAPAAPAELEPASVTVFGEKLLLYLEHAHAVAGADVRFLAHLTVHKSGEPLRKGRVVLEAGATRLSADAPERDGLFTPVGRFAAAGRFPARLVVTSEEATETLDLGELVVHPSQDTARQAASANAGGDPPDAVPFLMEQQWRVKLLVARAGPRTLARRLLVPAQVATPEGLAAQVCAPLAGRLVAPPAGALPRSGDRVTADQVLGLVEPPLSASELAQLRALDLELDLKALEVVRAQSDAVTRLHFAEREHERIGKLREQGLATQQQLDHAEQTLAIARSDDAAARATKASLDRLLAGRPPRDGGGAALRLPLTAPIDGDLIAAGRVAGDAVTAGEQLFRIVDGSRVWIEGRISEFDLARLQGAPEAAVTFPAFPGERTDLLAAGDARLVHVGPVVDPSSRTVVIRWEMPNPGGRLRAGMLAALELATSRVEAAVVVPADAVVMDQGLPTAYVMLAGELFQKRDLELGVEDGGFVEVRRGIAAGEHVAARGSHVVRLATLAPAGFGHGHHH